MKNHVSTRLHIFRFTPQWKFFAIIGLFIVLCIGMVVFAAIRGQLTLPLFSANAGILIFLLLPSYQVLINTSELLVDDTGISRRLFGRIAARLRWNDIKCIREKRVKVSRGSVTIIGVFSKRNPFGGIGGTPAISISEQVVGFRDLIDLLNEYVILEEIPVEMENQGVLERRTKIEYEADGRDSIYR